MGPSSDDIVGAFPSWVKSQPQYTDLDLTNIILVTLPQPILVQMIRNGGVTLGNLTLDVSRTSGFYPDIFMGYPGASAAVASAGCSRATRGAGVSARTVASRCSSAKAIHSAFMASLTLWCAPRGADSRFTGCERCSRQVPCSDRDPTWKARSRCSRRGRVELPGSPWHHASRSS